MSNDKGKLLWTLMWFIFIGGLCFLFNSAAPLWLLILWLIGVM